MSIDFKCCLREGVLFSVVCTRNLKYPPIDPVSYLLAFDSFDVLLFTAAEFTSRDIGLAVSPLLAQRSISSGEGCETAVLSL